MKKVLAVIGLVFLMLAYALTLGTRPDPSRLLVPGRYEMKVFTDGQVISFDTATGIAREIKPAVDEPPAPAAPPKPPDSRSF